MDLWAYQRGVVLGFSWPGKPTENEFIEAFNSKFRAECLNAHWFLSLSDACEKMEEWRGYYNKEGPHSAIGNIPPATLANSYGASARHVEKRRKALGPGGRRLGIGAEAASTKTSVVGHAIHNQWVGRIFGEKQAAVILRCAQGSGCGCDQCSQRQCF